MFFCNFGIKHNLPSYLLPGLNSRHIPSILRINCNSLKQELIRTNCESIAFMSRHRISENILMLGSLRSLAKCSFPPPIQIKWLCEAAFLNKKVFIFYNGLLKVLEYFCE
uniref:Uncharacterized protein n=1 Tax=Micrurus spixii TaxID=129469 RepID=A0A2D4NJ98_9SAUR